MTRRIHTQPLAELDGICRNLKARIDALVGGMCLYGDGAFTPRYAHYTVIRNGEPKDEGAVGAPVRDPYDMAERSFVCAQAMLGEITEAYVIWRTTPRFEKDGSFYLRLAIEDRG
jgi:hypothetical protein